MTLEGGCYCGELRYRVEGDPVLEAQCHCRECQYFSGGAPNLFMLVPVAGFRYTKGAPRTFTRRDLERPVTREFCAACGTHVVTHPVGVPGMLVLKVGTLDDPKQFKGPHMAINTLDKQPFHHIPEGLPSFERRPTR